MSETLKCSWCGSTNEVLDATFLTPHGRGVIICGFNEITENLCENCDTAELCERCGKRHDSDYYCPNCTVAVCPCGGVIYDDSVCAECGETAVFDEGLDVKTHRLYGSFTV